jgi:hypothetical protein
MRINYSRFSQYQTCPRLYYWKYVENLAPPRTATPLTVGKLLHEGLAAHYSGLNSLDHIDKAYDGLVASEKWMGPELEEMQKQLKYIHFMMHQYEAEFPTEHWTVLAPEVEGDVPIGNHTLHFRTDAIVEWKNNLWLLEHKTTAQLGPTFFKKFQMDGQITTYIYGVWAALPAHRRPVGAIINAIRKSKNLDKVAFEREVVMRSEKQINDFAEQMVRQCDIIEALHAKRAPKEAWLMHTGQCVRYNRICEFADLCTNDTPEARECFAKRANDYVDDAGEEL